MGGNWMLVGLLLASATTTPPAGATPVSPTVNSIGCSQLLVAGVAVSSAIVGGVAAGAAGGAAGGASPTMSVFEVPSLMARLVALDSSGSTERTVDLVAVLLPALNVTAALCATGKQRNCTTPVVVPPTIDSVAGRRAMAGKELVSGTTTPAGSAAAARVTVSVTNCSHRVVPGDTES